MKNCAANNKKIRNHSMDLLKFISSFMIVAIHYKFVGGFGEFFTIISRFAVPVFFMISGYYSFNDDVSGIKRKIFNIVKIYFFAFVLYFCFNVVRMMFSGQYREAIWYVSQYFRFRYISVFLLFNESVSAMHLWFLGALIYSYIIRYFCVKFKINDSLIYFLSAILILINVFVGLIPSVSGVELPWIMSRNYILRNFLFTGFPLFSLGCLIKKNETFVTGKIKWQHLLLMISVSVAEAFVMYGVDRMRDLYPGSVILGFSLFVIALKNKNVMYPPALIAVFGTCANVYILHIITGDILSAVIVENCLVYAYLKPVAVFCITVIICLIIKMILRCSEWFYNIFM